MNRFAPRLVGVGVAAAVGSLVVGNPLLSAAFVGPIVGLGAWVLRRRARPAPDQPWSTSPTDREPTVRPTPPPARRLVRALGWVEAREFLLSPWFGIGAGLTLVLLSFASSYDGDDTWSSVVQDLPFLAHPLVGMTVLAAHRAATRADRDGATELLASCPASRTRPASVLAAAVVPMAAVAIFAVAYLAVADISTDVVGPLGAASVPTVPTGIILGAGGVALGVALSQLARFALAPVLAVVAVGFVSLTLGAGTDGDYRPRMLLSTVGPVGDDAAELTSGQAWIHLAWLVAITILTAILAVAGRRHDRPVRGTAAAPITEPARELGAVS